MSEKEFRMLLSCVDELERCFYRGFAGFKRSLRTIYGHNRDDTDG